MIKLDTSGSILVVPTLTNGGTSFAYTYDLNGNQIDVTTVPYKQQYAAALSGQDVWFGGLAELSYSVRGSTAATTVNVLPSLAFLLDMQLVGTTLYALKNGDILQVMDPIQTQSGSFTALLSTVQAFYVHNDTILYTLSNGELSKYTIISPTTLSLQYKAFVAIYTITISLTAVEAGGVTYMVWTEYDSSTFDHYIRRATDSGTSFIAKTQILKSSPSKGQMTITSLSHSPQPSCSDGFKNQDEGDTDCGGSTCVKCSNDQSCSLSSDCSSTYCNSSNICATPTCNDNALNQDETDVDCGGNTCSACSLGQSCTINTDCLSNLCFEAICAESCEDGFKNQDETDVDCGGATCTSCADNMMCNNSSDCSSNYCNPENKCSTPTCSDGFKDQDESDTDCGGVTCDKCVDEKTCSVDEDCASSFCHPDSNVCKTATCQDTYQNQDETDIDCGGSNCSKCAVGKKCVMDSDCDSNDCQGGVCISPPVSSPPTGIPVSSSPETVAPISASPVSSTPPISQKISSGLTISMPFQFLIIRLILRILVM